MEPRKLESNRKAGMRAGSIFKNKPVFTPQSVAGNAYKWLFAWIGPMKDLAPFD
jgi:hypothetical protein